MSASLDIESEWNFRSFSKRLIVVKTKNVVARKAVVLDVLTNFMFAVEVSENIALEQLVDDKEFLANLKVYTSKDLRGVDKDFTEFFENVDVDQEMEAFIRAYWVYPGKIRFELVDVEEP